MKYSYLFVLMISYCCTVVATNLPHEVQELADTIERTQEVASINIDGFYAGTHQLPSCSFCNQVKDAAFKHDPVVKAWYLAFGNCRCSEHHEFIRSLEWAAAPTLGGVAGFMSGNYLADAYQLKHKLVTIPCALVLALQASQWNKKIYGWLSDFLDRRADGAAVTTCMTDAEKERVIAHLQESTKDMFDTTPTDQEYQLFCVNAYDGAQSNLCSFITIHIQFPVPWLPSGDEIKQKLQRRVAYLQSFLTDK